MVELDETALRSFLRERRFLLVTILFFPVLGVVVAVISHLASVLT